MSDADKWPKSFRWPGVYPAARDVVTFLHDKDVDLDQQGIAWTYGECASEPAGGIAYWVPTDQHNQKSPPAPSQDDVKAARLEGVIKSIRFCEDDIEMCRREKGDIEYLCRAVQFLADAVERLAK